MMCYQTVIGQMLCFAVQCCYVVSSLFKYPPQTDFHVGFPCWKVEKSKVYGKLLTTISYIKEQSHGGSRLGMSSV